MEGQAHWNKPFPFRWAMAATPRDSVIYVGRVLTTLDGKTGTELWRTDVKFNIFGPSVYIAYMEYVGTLMERCLALI
jgi:outer membrane protein assembly factor BamB